MDPRIVFFGIVFFVLLGFYSINLFLYRKKNIKYLISFSFLVFGIIGWMYVGFGPGWLMTAVISTGFLALSIISLLMALLLDFVFNVKPSQKG